MDVPHLFEPPVLPRVLGLAIGAALLVTAASPPVQSGSFVNNLLRQERFSASDLRALDAGEAVVKTLETPVRQELAHFGAVYIEAPADRFVDRFGDIERFERGPGIPQIGRFGSPPRLADLSSLTLPAKDVTALATCHSGDCDVKLSTAAMTRFRNQVDWSSRNAAKRAHEIARDMILELLRAYQANGNAALGSYNDGGEPVVIAEQFRALLDSGHLYRFRCWSS